MKSEDVLEVALMLKAANSLIQLVATTGFDLYQQVAIFASKEDLTDEQLQAIISDRIKNHQEFKDAIENARTNIPSDGASST